VLQSNAPFVTTSIKLAKLFQAEAGRPNPLKAAVNRTGIWLEVKSYCTVWLTGVCTPWVVLYIICANPKLLAEKRVVSLTVSVVKLSILEFKVSGKLLALRFWPIAKVETFCVTVWLVGTPKGVQSVMLFNLIPICHWFQSMPTCSYQNWVLPGPNPSTPPI